ncbi:MAG: hypothetical protein WB791_08530 [Waddliaceae bacterium]
MINFTSVLIFPMAKRLLASIVLMAVFSGCMRYGMPMVTESHPACPDVDTYQMELSPILDIDPGDLPPVPSDEAY